MKSTAEMFYYVQNHPRLLKDQAGAGAIEVMPVDVDPVTNEYDVVHPENNTKPSIWLELSAPQFYDKELHGPMPLGTRIVDVHMCGSDCGGDTFDEAVRNLYNKTIELYGEYTEEEREAFEQQLMQRDSEVWDRAQQLFACLRGE